MKIFRKTKNLCNSVLATRSQVKPATKFPCFAKIGLNLKQFSKTFQLSLASHAHTLSYPPLPLLKPPLSLRKTTFSSSILHQSSRKGMGFLLFSMYFKFLALVFLDFVYMLRNGNMVVEYGFVDVLMSRIYGFCSFFFGIMLILHVLHVCSSFLCIVLCFVLCCVVHTMFMIKCLLAVFVCLFGFH